MTIRVSNSLDPDLDRLHVGPVSADDKKMQQCSLCTLQKFDKI